MNDVDITSLLKNKLPDCKFSITGEHCNFTITAIGDCFINKSKLQRQQMINGILQQEIANGHIHALTLKTYTSAEWSITNG